MWKYAKQNFLLLIKCNRSQLPNTPHLISLFFQCLGSQLAACNAIWNFFTVDDEGNINESAKQTFTGHRASENLVSGTFLISYVKVYSTMYVYI